MDGYGTVLSLEQGRLQQYNVTRISCLKGYDGTQEGATGPGGVVSVRLSGSGPVITLHPEATGQRARWQLASSVGHRALTRIAELPQRCREQTPSDPLTTFDVFWQTFAENYPFFAAKGIDWQAVREQYRPRVTDETTPRQLFAVLRDMIEPLHDAHTGLWGDQDDFEFQGLRPGTVAAEEIGKEAKAFIVRRDLGGTMKEYADGAIGYADLPGGQGYLRISRFAGYGGPDEGADAVELTKALDDVFTSARTSGPGRLRGLIIDVRVNQGGSDALGLQVASRLTSRPYVAYLKQARNNAHDPTRFTRPQPITVRPATTAARYTGPVALLTGGSTFSAGETFTQALINRPGRVVRIGENTQGVFSDVLPVQLPNGWEFVLGNERFITRGRSFDGGGIPPHIRVPVFTGEQFRKDQDPAFDQARALLSAG